jgi:hypothetical protein
VRPVVAIIGSFIAVVASLAMFFVTLMLMWGHAMAEEPFDLDFYRTPLSLVVVGLAMLLLAFRLGSGKWPWHLRRTHKCLIEDAGGARMGSGRGVGHRLLLSLAVVVGVPLVVSLLAGILLPEDGATMLGGLVVYAGVLAGVIAAGVVFFRSGSR